MEIDDLKSILLRELPDAQLRVQGEGCNFSVDVIAPSFAGVTKLNRQKRVLACIKEQLASGEIHAMSVKAYTPEEWAGSIVTIQT